MESSNRKARQLASFIQKNPDDSFSKFALALEFLKENQLDKARILFENIRKHDPDYDGVYYHLGKLYERENRLEDALETYERGIKVAKRNHKERNATELEEALSELKLEMD